VPIQQNKPWTDEDDRRLMELQAAGRSIASVSAALRRSAVVSPDGSLFSARGHEPRRMPVLFHAKVSSLTHNVKAWHRQRQLHGLRTYP
jgi:hypothetical protein